MSQNRPKPGHEGSIPFTRYARRICLSVVLSVAITAHAAPYGINIPLPSATVGAWYAGPNTYVIDYDSNLGGHWHTTYGKRRNNRDGTYTDTFRATVSDISLSRTITNGGSDQWLSDSWYLENGVHGWLACTTFTVTISGGLVTGTATYAP